MAALNSLLENFQSGFQNFQSRHGELIGHGSNRVGDGLLIQQMISQLQHSVQQSTAADPAPSASHGGTAASRNEAEANAKEEAAEKEKARKEAEVKEKAEAKAQEDCSRRTIGTAADPATPPAAAAAAVAAVARNGLDGGAPAAIAVAGRARRERAHLS
jgi:hypothetical protein